MSDGTSISSVTFTWSSDNPEILSIDANGLASGIVRRNGDHHRLRGWGLRSNGGASDIPALL
ncbi:MAG: hypothetical protein MPW15_14385 [Candidatus Manganitrophus sp.]|nr:hypothetical protein [Candidatus Manganitrophus sp.]